MRVARSPASLLFAFPYGTLKSPSIASPACFTVAYMIKSPNVFQARLPWQGMVKLYKGSIFVNTETQFVTQSQVT